MKNAIKPYIALMRLEKPVGIWLLMWPCFWGVMLGFFDVLHGQFGSAECMVADGLLYPPLCRDSVLHSQMVEFLLLFAVGAVVMRSAGCVVNDIADRKYDALVERTKGRPLACGDISVFSAFVTLAVLLLVALYVAVNLGDNVVTLAVISLPLVVLYPFMKRITWWPQLFLGIVFNSGILFGWVAVKSGYDFDYSVLDLWSADALPAWILYFGAIFWTLGYDTIYALQDVDDDEKIGVKSTARLLHKNVKIYVGAFYAIFAGCVVASAHLLYGGVNIYFYVSALLAALHLCAQIVTLDVSHGVGCMRRFKSNSLVGFIIFIAFFSIFITI